MGSMATDSDLERMKQIMRSLTNFRRGSSKRLVDGLYYERSVESRIKWVLSIYRNKLTPGNDIEIAIDVPPLIWPDDSDHKRLFAALGWLEHQKRELENLPSKMHAHQVPNAFRIGVLVPNAFEFLERLQQQFVIRDERARWQMPEAQPAPLTEVPHAGGQETTTDATSWEKAPAFKIVERMLQTVLQTCAQSGSSSVITAKEKRFLFGSEDEFRQVTRGLLAACGGLCKLTGVELDMSEQDGDLSPSLDRIDSNGHYGPGNLQIVARFANRWKSDSADKDFLRLLQLVRSAGQDKHAL